MKRHVAKIKPRERVFLGCEGRSEFGYGALLARIASEVPTVHLHIHAEILQPGAGDPFELVRRATDRIAKIERYRMRFKIKAVLLDIGDKQKNADATKFAHGAGIDYLIWQQPDHEGFLLRHLPGCNQRRPPRGASLDALIKEWPDYAKGMSGVQLEHRIGLNELLAACKVESDLRAFVAKLGLSA